MNMNKPEWQSDDKDTSLRDYAEWLNDNARTMFLDDHAHMEIVFLLAEDGQAATIPVPTEQDRDEILSSIYEQVKQGTPFAVIQIVQRMIDIPEREQPGPIEAVVLHVQTRAGNSYMLVNEIVETETELTLEPCVLLENPKDEHLTRFF